MVGNSFSCRGPRNGSRRMPVKKIGVDSGEASIVTAKPTSRSVSLPRPAKKLSHSLA